MFSGRSLCSHGPHPQVHQDRREAHQLPVRCGSCPIYARPAEGLSRPWPGRYRSMLPSVRTPAVALRTQARRRNQHLACRRWRTGCYRPRVGDSVQTDTHRSRIPGSMIRRLPLSPARTVSAAGSAHRHHPARRAARDWPLLIYWRGGRRQRPDRVPATTARIQSVDYTD